MTKTFLFGNERTLFVKQVLVNLSKNMLYSTLTLLGSVNNTQSGKTYRYCDCKINTIFLILNISSYR